MSVVGSPSGAPLDASAFEDDKPDGPEDDESGPVPSGRQDDTG